MGSLSIATGLLQNDVARAALQNDQFSKPIFDARMIKYTDISKCWCLAALDHVMMTLQLS
jgi:hypothetical protein